MSGILSLLMLLSGFTRQKIPAEPRVIHVVVALCDNAHQGIIPVPAELGNGRDPARNLYWGALYGVKTSLKNHPGWALVGRIDNPPSPILERLVFKRNEAPVYLVADAYDGAELKQALLDFLSYSAGLKKEDVAAGEATVRAGGNADLLCYVGHNGLMDFDLESSPPPTDRKKREAVVLACASKPYFASHLRTAGASPLVWTTGLMSPEAYTLTAVLDSWIENETPETTIEEAARAYDRYQKCGIAGARKLIVTGY